MSLRLSNSRKSFELASLPRQLSEPNTLSSFLRVLDFVTRPLYARVFSKLRLGQGLVGRNEKLFLIRDF